MIGKALVSTRNSMDPSSLSAKWTLHSLRPRGKSSTGDMTLKDDFTTFLILAVTFDAPEFTQSKWAG
ncbi:hypothetical protein SBA5_20024 [Candidatus Sulfotelmatomonas gaucii]|uniref:Uncharacterized protein n=1 Tax=Candidatus Sulfuritelmatomonas gaucii TaxID=2043161 RepID=A0A2N9L706_9BACT|nr:hypothetical protein SBA5_20024 [Candidatus Sulfotelmatomonas gaucii]